MTADEKYPLLICENLAETKLRTPKEVVRQLPKKSRVRRHYDKQHGKRS